jgi:flagellar biosynthesis protein FliR
MTQAQLESVLVVFVRLLPLCLLLTSLTRGWVGASVALSLGLALAAGLAPGLAVPALPTLGAAALGALFLRELCLGSLVALSLGLPLAAAGWSARFSELAALPGGARSGPIATLYGLAALFLALTLGAHRSLVVAFHESFLAAPPTNPVFHVQAFGLGVVRLVADALGLAVALGLPLLVSVLLLSASWALVARLLGQRGLDAWGASLKGPLFGLLAAVLIAPAVMEVPAALRTGLRVVRELTRSVGT